MKATAQWVNHHTMALTRTNWYFCAIEWFEVAVRLNDGWNRPIQWCCQCPSPSVRSYPISQQHLPWRQILKGLDRNDRDWGGPYSQCRKKSNRIGNQKHGYQIQFSPIQSLLSGPNHKEADKSDAGEAKP